MRHDFTSSPLCGMTRRSALSTISCGFGSLALAGLAGKNAEAATASAGMMVPKAGLFPARAKRIIFLNKFNYLIGMMMNINNYIIYPMRFQEQNGPFQ